MRRVVLGVLSMLVAGCAGTPPLHEGWPTDLDAARLRAAEAHKPCVLFYGVTDAFDHNLGDWQEAFLESPETSWVRGRAELVATPDWAACEALAEEFPFLGYGGPRVLVLSPEGELLNGFYAYGGYVRRGSSRPTTAEFVAMLGWRIKADLERGLSVAELTRRALRDPHDEPVFRELMVRFETCNDYGSMLRVCERVLEARAELRQEFVDEVERRHAEAVSWLAPYRP